MNILIVDNDIDYRKALSEFLLMSGHAVFSADDGSAAFGFLQRETIDLVISDINMPGVSGPELHRKMRSEGRFADIPFVFVSGYPDLRGSSVIQDPDKDHVMSKLSSAKELVRVIRQHAVKAPPLSRPSHLASTV